VNATQCVWDGQTDFMVAVFLIMALLIGLVIGMVGRRR
jgi:hypothetical protein